MAEKLKATYDTVDEVPEALRDLYEERDGKFFLAGVEGFVEKKRLDEFRTSNIRLSQQIEDLQTRFEGIDPEEVKTLRSKIAEWDEKRQEIEDQKLLDEKNIEEIRRQATKKLAEERDKGFQDRDKRIQSLEDRLNSLLINDELRRIGMRKKLNDWAVEDLVTIGSNLAGLTEDGKPVVYEMRSGQRAIRYNDEGEPLSLEEWADEQIATRAGWLPASSGGGVHHQSAGATSNGAVKVSTKPVGQWTTAEKVQYINKHGAGAWEQLISGRPA